MKRLIIPVVILVQAWKCAEGSNKQAMVTGTLARPDVLTLPEGLMEARQNTLRFQGDPFVTTRSAVIPRLIILAGYKRPGL